MRRKICLFSSFFVLTILSYAQPAPGNNVADGYYRVTKIVDGDTFWVDDGSKKGLKIRLIGVDAPESRNTGYKKKAYYGDEATKFLMKLIGGSIVKLEYDVARLDRYGRTLAYVFLGNGTFVNASLVKNGYATVMTIPPNVRYADTFVQLARKARKQKKVYGEKKDKDRW